MIGKIKLGIGMLACLFMLTACPLEKASNKQVSSGKVSSGNIGSASTATGIAYNQKGGFQTDKNFKGQAAGPNLVFVEGGRFVMGTVEEDVLGTHDNIERTVSVQSFYMDETEIANIHWLEYLYAVQKDSTQDFYEQSKQVVVLDKI